MSSHKAKICRDAPLHQYDPDTTRLVNSVRDEQFRDKILENVFKQSTMENPYLRNVKHNIDICTELREDQRKKFVEEKRRQQLRENNEELKKLEQQIRAGYVMRTVQAQIFEKQAIAKDLKANEDAESYRVLMAQMQLQDAADEEKARARKEDLRKDLDEQITQKKEVNRKKYQELLHERQIMEDAIKKYKEDLEKEKRDELEKTIKTRKELDEHVHAKLQYEADQDQAWEEEEKRYQELLIQREEEHKKVQEENRKKTLQKQLISQEIGEQIHAIEVEKARKRDLLAELLCDEREARDAIQMKEHLLKQQHNKLLAHQEMERIRKLKEEEKLAEKRAEDAYFQEEMRLLAERDKLEQLSDEKRRKKQMEHRKALQEGLNSQKVRKAEQMKTMIRTREELVHEEEKRERCIREERIRMLKEHAHILKYCAPGMVRDSEKKLLKVQSSLN